MFRIIYFLVLFSFLFNSCNPYTSTERHIFYLHGKIIETQGVNANSEKFGPYKYLEIIQALEKTGAKVHQDIRTESTNFDAYTLKLSKQISKLVESGIPPNLISVIGASKGALLAMQVSSQTIYPINYVLLGANNKQIEEQYTWMLHGNVLGIYESTDKIAGKNYDHWINRSKQTSHFEQLEIKTGLGHGFLYTPRPEWLEPCLEWISKYNKKYKRIR